MKFQFQILRHFEKNSLEMKIRINCQHYGDYHTEIDINVEKKYTRMHDTKRNTGVPGGHMGHTPKEEINNSIERKKERNKEREKERKKKG